MASLTSFAAIAADCALPVAAQQRLDTSHRFPITAPVRGNAPLRIA
jgi:hypothetical protein